MKLFKQSMNLGSLGLSLWVEITVHFLLNFLGSDSGADTDLSRGFEVEFPVDIAFRWLSDGSRADGGGFLV